MRVACSLNGSVLALAGVSKLYVLTLCTLLHCMTNGMNLETNIPSLSCNCLYCRFAWRFLNSCRLFSLSNHRPSQHGADLLSLLSKLIEENSKPGETKNHSTVVIVSLALQALEELCKAEVCVIDIEEHKAHANPCDHHESLNITAYSVKHKI